MELTASSTKSHAVPSLNSTILHSIVHNYCQFRLGSSESRPRISENVQQPHGEWETGVAIEQQIRAKRIFQNIHPAISSVLWILAKDQQNYEGPASHSAQQCLAPIDSPGIEAWRHGGMEAWRHGGMEAWRHGGMEAWRHGGMEAWRHGGMEAWRHGGMEAWRHGGMEACMRHGGMEAWRHGGMEAWRHGGMEAWRHGGMEAWRHGGMEAWRHGGMEEKLTCEMARLSLGFDFEEAKKYLNKMEIEMEGR
ncbi:hypothetical protein V496_08477 [Pseudogymnoascus sp. VKM F-4515 (FW-2607)]|nr:hypothetical protein V496_08477 [Pseudogymnoascus sp. VKM F-4515 (FW-2607)]